MFLFIFESIGTSELILIAIVGLVFLGPRKLPEIARQIGKFMADFRTTTNDFKDTWEKEVNFEEEAKVLRERSLGDDPIPRTKIVPDPVDDEQIIAAPEIKSMDKEDFENLATKNRTHEPEEEPTETEPRSNDQSDKRNWL